MDQEISAARGAAYALPLAAVAYFAVAWFRPEWLNLKPWMVFLVLYLLILGCIYLVQKGRRSA